MQNKLAWVDSVAMDLAAAYERQRGREPADVSQGRAPAWAREALEQRDQSIHLAHMDLISRDAGTEALRFIEVKGRSLSGPVAVNRRQLRAMQLLQGESWLYVVFNTRAAWDAKVSDPYLIEVNDPRRLPWTEAQGGGLQVDTDAVVEAGTRVFSAPPTRRFDG